MFNCTLNDYLLNILEVDILCMQETRGSKAKLEVYKNMQNYKGYFCHSKIRNGHAGVGFFINKKLFCKQIVSKFESIQGLCDEGRIIFGDFGTFSILNIYFPFYDDNFGVSEEKYEKVKLSYDKIGDFIQNDRNSIVCGDFNACYLLKDHYQYIREMQRMKQELSKMQKNGVERITEEVNTIIDVNQEHLKPTMGESADHTVYNMLKNAKDYTKDPPNAQVFKKQKKEDKTMDDNITISLQNTDTKKVCKSEVFTPTFEDGKTRLEKPYKSSTELPFYFKNPQALIDYFFEKYQRSWLLRFVNRNHFIDIYDYYHPTVIKFTCWNVRYDLRPSNLGTRIDYIFVSKDLLTKIHAVEIKNEIYGSDHCPVILDIELEVQNDAKNILKKNNTILSFFNKK